MKKAELAKRIIDSIEDLEDAPVNSFNKKVLLDLADTEFIGDIDDLSVEKAQELLQAFLKKTWPEEPQAHKYVIGSCLALAFLFEKPLHPQEKVHYVLRVEDGKECYYCSYSEKGTICDYCPAGKLTKGGFPMIKSITVDRDKCIHCGMCIRECVVNCIAFDPENIPHYVPGGEQMCVGCQHCFAVCPTGALAFGGKNSADSFVASFGNSDELLRLIQSRRSVRSFKQQDVPTELISKIISMLAYPPRGGNADSLHFSIVGTEEKMRAIREFTYKTIQGISESSPIIEFCRDNFNKGIDFIFRGAPSMIAVSVNRAKAVAGCENADPIIALSYLDLYAQSLGLGTLWNDCALSVMQELPEVRGMLEIPEGFELNYIMLLGIPAVKYQRTVQREPANVTIV